LWKEPKLQTPLELLELLRLLQRLAWPWVELLEQLLRQEWQWFAWAAEEL
jgi:hypothetical protein